MKEEQNAVAAGKPRKGRDRTVKVSDDLHHKIRVLAVQRRMPMQHFLEQLLKVSLREKVYDKFASEKAAAA